MNHTPIVTGQSSQPTTGTAVLKAKPSAAMVKRVKARKVAQTKGKAAPVKVAPVDPYAAAVAAAEAQKFDPAQAGIEAQQRANTQRGIDSAGWFAQYRQQIAAANQQAADTGARVQAGMAAFGNAATVNDAQGASMNLQQMQADASSRGATVDPATLQTAINAAAVRRDNGAGLGRLAGINVEATAGRGAGALRNASAQGLQSRQDLAGNDARLLSALTDLGKQRGDFRVTQRASLVDAAQRRMLENALAQANLGIKQQNADTGVKRVETTAATADKNREAGIVKTKIQVRAANQRWGRTLNKYGVSNAAWTQWGKTDAGKAKRAAAITASKSGRGSRGNSPYLGTGPQNTAKDAIDSARTAVLKLKESYSEADVRRLLLNGRPASSLKVDSKTKKLADENTPKERIQVVPQPAIPKVPKAYLNVAMDLGYRNGISQANVKALHARGIKVKPLGYKILGPGPRPQGTLQGVIDSVGNSVSEAIG